MGRMRSKRWELVALVATTTSMSACAEDPSGESESEPQALVEISSAGGQRLSLVGKARTSVANPDRVQLRSDAVTPALTTKVEQLADELRPVVLSSGHEYQGAADLGLAEKILAERGKKSDFGTRSS